MVVELESLREEVGLAEASMPTELLKVARGDDAEEVAEIEALDISEEEMVKVTADELIDKDSEELFVPLLPEIFCVGPTEEVALVV